ncbi:MAG: HlyD family secretion protein [Caulobacteraceae bacterium]
MSDPEPPEAPHDPRSTGFAPDAPPKAAKDKPPAPPPPPKPKKKPIWPWLLAGLVVLGFIALVLWLIFAPNPRVSTDDARVVVHYATIAPRVSGQVVRVAVNDNQPVRAGQLLAQLDDRDYVTAVQRAQATLERDEAQASGTQAQVERQPDLIQQSASNVPSAQAKLELAQANAQRYRNLAATGAGTQQDRQQAEATLRQAQADLVGAQAALKSSQHQLDVLKADHDAAEALVRQDRAALAQAQLNLSYTRITAPLDGLVGQRTIEEGDYVAPGGALMTVMPLNAVYIEANYREVALHHVRPGQHARIHVDAYGIDLDGVVDSIAPASGATFAPVAPENATGNFTKIVQRLPVKIVVSPNQPLARLLRVGFSVETTIDTHLDNLVAAERQHPATLP